MTQTHAFTPWHDPSWTVAAHPCTKGICLRQPDWWFDLHPRSCFANENKNWHPGYYTWLKALRQPIFMQEDWPDVPMAIRYPKERIMGEFRAYFTNHCAWMIALAMTEGVTHIGVFGCEYSHEAERGMQRGSLEFWLGMFEGRGGHVILPPGSRVLNKPAELYGYESHDKEGRLVESYRAKVKPAATQPSVPHVLTPVDEKTVVGRIPLRPLPEGMEPAWDRSGHTLHC